MINNFVDTFMLKQTIAEKSLSPRKETKRTFENKKRDYSEYGLISIIILIDYSCVGAQN